jgi:hypothetical protein
MQKTIKIRLKTIILMLTNKKLEESILKINVHFASKSLSMLSECMKTLSNGV